MSKSDSIFSIGLLALAAYVLWSMGLFEKPKERTETTSTTAAEKAIAASEASNDPWLKKVYDQKYLKSACSWYDRIFDPIGCAVKDTVGAPSNTSGTEHSPQTPPPTAAFSLGATCPENPTILAGDRRCGMQTPGNESLTTGINPFTGEPWIPTGGFL